VRRWAVTLGVGAACLAMPAWSRAEARSPSASADVTSLEPDGTASAEQPVRPHRFGVELNTVQPFIPTVNIIRPKLTWTIFGEPGGFRGDAIVGAYIRPHIEHDILFTIDEYMGTLGYRQYFWRGLHLETMLSAGAAWGTNRYDGEAYDTPTLFMDVNAGYRFGFFEPGGFAHDGTESVGFFVTLQGGTIFSLGVSDIGPRNGKPDYFAQGDLLLGVSF